MKNINIKLIIRNFWKNRLFSLINITGLAIGIGCVIIIFLFVEYELSFDKFYQDRERIFRIVRDINHSNTTSKEGETSYMLSPSMRLDFPEYEFAGVFNNNDVDIVINKEVIKVKNMLFIDSVYFKIFKYHWLLGSPELITQNKNNIAITESFYQKFFKEENPIGKTITLSPDEELQIVGLLKDPPKNSSQPFAIVGSIDLLSGKYLRVNIKKWDVVISGYENYIKIPKNANPQKIGEDITRIIHEKYAKPEETGEERTYKLQAIADIHLEPDYENIENTYSTSRKNIWILSSIGLLIILIAAINFINLSTAHALKRSKEVGIKKVLGATRKKISIQFLLETFILTLIALILSIIIVEISLPYINAFLGKNFDLSLYSSRHFYIFILILYVFISLITGIYPSFVLSGFSPVKALKNIFNTPKKSSVIFRNGLVVFQFFISIVLLICTITIHKQMNYIDNFDLGFDTENIAIFRLPDNSEKNINEISSFLRHEPGVVSYTFASGAPTANSNLRTSFRPPGSSSEEKYDVNVKLTDTSYLKMFNINLLAGRWMHKKHPKDTLFEIIVNEKFCKDYGFKSIDEALNQYIDFDFIAGHIRGVVKDFHLVSLKRGIQAAVFIEYPHFFLEVLIKVHPERKSETLNKIQSKIAEVFPKNFITYEMYTDDLKNRYNTEQQTSNIITIFSILAIFIASLGLFGLVSFMIVQRLKEISVRKVLGASIVQNMWMLFKDYLRLVIIACFIAIPVGWYAMDQWLNEFHYRISFSWWIFLLSAVLALILAVLTILYHVIKSSNSNPVDSLKVE